MTKPTWPDFFFIRHGETDWNFERRYQGRRDIPINETGRGQADKNGRVLAAAMEARNLDPAQFEWHASPLLRTRETMDRVRAAFAVPLPEVRYDVRLVEISFGVLEGMLHDELPDEVALPPGRRDATHWEFKPEEGESYLEVAERLNDFATTLRGPAVIVAHGGIARVLRVLVEGIEILDAVNWLPPQDVVLHFTPGRMEILGS